MFVTAKANHIDKVSVNVDKELIESVCIGRYDTSVPLLYQSTASTEIFNHVLKPFCVGIIFLK